MNEKKEIQIDRFYKEPCQPVLVTSISLPTKNCLKFAPEPIHMRESLRKGKFTVGNKYEILDRKNERDWNTTSSPYCAAGYSVKTLDDEGREVWTDDTYFIPADKSLTFDKEECLEATEIDIREVAAEKGIPTVMDLFRLHDIKVLSGLKESEWTDDLKCEETIKYDFKWKVEPFWKTTCQKKMRPERKKFYITEGVIKNTGNDLMYNSDKCLEAISHIFGGNAIIDPDDIINSIQELFHNHKLSWQDKCLTVDEAKTKITYEEVQGAFSGLAALVSTKMAAKTVSKLVANKLKKLF